MPNAAPQNLAQHITSAFIRGLHAVGDEEGGGAGVVGDDAERCGAFGVG
jgi:hypothetical protein